VLLQWDLAALRLLCSNDVESNPGPLQPLSKGFSMDKVMMDFRKEMKVNLFLAFVSKETLT
jgi:hypothetical protein